MIVNVSTMAAGGVETDLLAHLNLRHVKEQRQTWQITAAAVWENQSTMVPVEPTPADTDGSLS